MIKIIKSMLTEYGISWTINRSLYSAKLSLMKTISFTEKLFEKKVNIKKIDIFKFDVEMINNFLLKLNLDQKKSLISIADKAIDGKIKGFSSIELDYGKPINWHLNPLTGYENDKRKKWYRIKDFDEKIGDIKVIWEASRLTHFLYFARAYLITGKIKYYEAFSSQLDNWIKNNPYSYGSNYKCGQEATLRMLNVLIVYAVFDSFNLVTVLDKKNIYKVVQGSYKKVLSNFFYAHKCIKNNHTFTEILGLIVGSWCSDNKKGILDGYKLMDQEIKNQFLSDGGFTQYSFNYHRFTLQIFECLFKVSEVTGIKISETERIKKSVLLLYQVQEENGDVPNYGSNDGALIFPLTICDYRDFRPVINTMYALLEGKRLYKTGAYDEELLWFGKTNDLPFVNMKRNSIAFEDSGYFILRRNNGFLMTCLQNYKSRPAHMDQLHIDLWYKGLNIFCDTGTYSYASKLGEKLSLTSGHNTVKIPEIEQMNKLGTFLITNWTKRTKLVYSPNSFLGKLESRNGYSHQREIIAQNSGYLIIDKIIADSNVCNYIFNTPYDVHLRKDGFEIMNNDNSLVRVRTDGEFFVTEDYRSLYYLKKEKINKIVVRKKMVKNRGEFHTEIILQ